jgi:ribosome-binding protein aMBF1 (putative translation factor)
MNVPQLMDKAKERAGITSDYALAKTIAASQSKVSSWRTEVNAPDAEGALKLAGLAGIEPVAALAVCELAKTRDPDKTAFWKTIAAGGVWRKR